MTVTAGFGIRAAWIACICRKDGSTITPSRGQGVLDLCSSTCRRPMHGCGCKRRGHLISKRHDTVGLHAKLYNPVERAQVLAAWMGINHWGKMNLAKKAAVKEGKYHEKYYWSHFVTLCI